jgi:hypothetical protein
LAWWHRFEFCYCGFFGAVFTELGTANCTPYEIELSDPTPVHLQPYQCAPPKLEILKKMVDELLEQGVVRPTKSGIFGAQKRGRFLYGC